MKKLILILSAIVLLVWKSYGITVTPGGLESAMEATDVSTMTDLVIDGSVDARDFHFIASNMTSLKHLDLTNAKVEAYSGKEYLFANMLNYGANELPVGCFAGMPLETILLPNTLVSVSDGAFAGCLSLSSISIPESVREIGDYAFSGDLLLVSANLGSGVTEIGDYAFSKCVAMNEVNMPGVQIIGAYAFLGCEAMRVVDFSVDLIAIGEGAFKESGIVSANLKDCQGLSVISAWAFADTKSLSTVVLPETVSTIGEGAFFYSTALEKAVLPEGVAVINNYAFGSTDQLLEDDFLPSTITKIGDYAFEDWHSVVKFVVPENVEYIGKGAFKDWEALSLLEAKPVVPPVLGEDVWENVDKTAIQLEVPIVSSAAYKNADQWRDFFFSGSFDEENIDYSKVKFTVNDDIITLTADAGLKGATIFDLSGIILVEKVVSSPSVSFDLSGYSAKAYIVRCVCADGTVKFIKFGVK